MQNVWIVWPKKLKRCKSTFSIQTTSNYVLNQWGFVYCTYLLKRRPPNKHSSSKLFRWFFLPANFFFFSGDGSFLLLSLILLPQMFRKWLKWKKSLQMWMEWSLYMECNHSWVLSVWVPVANRKLNQNAPTHSKTTKVYESFEPSITSHKIMESSTWNGRWKEEDDE